MTWVALSWIVVVILLAITANWLPIKGYGAVVGDPSEAPGFRLPEALGTDDLGRSVLSRLIFGARVSLTVAVVSVAIGTTIGGILGMMAGYFRGWLEWVVGVLVDSVLAFPPLVLLLTIAAVRGASLVTLVIGLVLVSIPTFTRLARANTLSQAHREYVLSARSLGAGDVRILFTEILPNIVLPVASYAVAVAALLMIAEGSLSFLGLGIPPPEPSWGGMVAEGRDYLSTAPFLVIVPALTMFVTILALNVLGDYARRRAGIGFRGD
jgi:peptide/nickel transport system permease protein